MANQQRGTSFLKIAVYYQTHQIDEIIHYVCVLTSYGRETHSSVTEDYVLSRHVFNVSRNSEAFASEFLEILKTCFPFSS